MIYSLKRDTIGQISWRDNNFVLFATTVRDLTATVLQPRTRPATSGSKAAKTR